MDDHHRALWAGAKVRWTGESPREGLEPGGVYIVFDPGPWGLRSFSMFRVGNAPRRAPRGVGDVVVETPHGLVAVHRDELQVVFDEHPLRSEPDPRPAAWLNEALDLPVRLTAPRSPIGFVVPRGFEAVAKVWHPFTGRDGRQVSWAEVRAHAGPITVGTDPDLIGDGDARKAVSEVSRRLGLRAPEEGLLPDAVAEPLQPLLTAATSAPDDVCYLVWQGFGDVPRARWPDAAEIDHGSRSYWLLRGPLSAANAPLGIATTPGGQRGAQLWWPADRAWVVATEIDFVWSYVAGTSGLVQRLVDHPALEAEPLPSPPGDDPRV